jgi:hypothetical protein
MAAFLLALLAARASACSSFALMKVGRVSFPHDLHGENWNWATFCFLAEGRSREPRWESGPPALECKITQYKDPRTGPTTEETGAAFSHLLATQALRKFNAWYFRRVMCQLFGDKVHGLRNGTFCALDAGT